MSKSLGNVVEPGEIIKQHGAEILRLWVAMLNYKEDARFGQEILQRLVEAYRKLRNTWRFLLGNLFDFNPATDTVSEQELHWLDRWILERERQVASRVLEAYDQYEFHIVFHTLYNFFTVDLSAFYLDVIKDRMYCSGAGSLERRSGQTALFYVLNHTLRLMAPVLPFTTEEAWEVMPFYPGKEESVHLCSFPEEKEAWLSEDNLKKAGRLLEIRAEVQKELEKAREDKLVGNSLEAQIIIQAPPEDFDLLAGFRPDLPMIFIVSAVGVEPGSGPELKIRVERATGQKCERCWNFSTSVGQDADYPLVCDRCVKVLKADYKNK